MFEECRKEYAANISAEEQLTRGSLDVTKLLDLHRNLSSYLTSFLFFLLCTTKRCVAFFPFICCSFIVAYLLRVNGF